MDLYRNCQLCPRKCGVNRFEKAGVCGEKAVLTAGKASLHLWEEPCISYKNGAGTVFFSGCNLKCVYCQNHEISNKNYGKELNGSELAEVFLRLQDIGADNIELVTPTHFVPDIINALDRIRHKLWIPVVYNTGSYELTETIDMLDGYIDVYLPDIKYFSSELSEKYSNAPDYFEYASRAVKAMVKQVGNLKYNSKGGIIKGTVIRHLVLPNCRHDSMNIVKWIAENTSPENVLVSLMSQYTPFDFAIEKYPELNRRVTKMEYNSVVKYAESLGINGFIQEKSSATTEYVPNFDLSGL